jgi:hypothetical protein
MTPFEAVYGQNPLSVLSYFRGVSKVQAVDQTLTVHEDILRTLKENLVIVQNRMKQQTDQGHSECQFAEGDQVFLRLQPYKQNSLKADHCEKPTPKFYGPYTVLKRVGQVDATWEPTTILQAISPSQAFRTRFFLRRRTC